MLILNLTSDSPVYLQEIVHVFESFLESLVDQTGHLARKTAKTSTFLVVLFWAQKSFFCQLQRGALEVIFKTELTPHEDSRIAVTA